MRSSVDITVLCNNDSVCGQIRTEHGLSMHVSTPSGNLLFDTGQSDVFLDNAEALQISLDKLSALVLSHGHYDHTGGLAYGTALFSNLPIYFHPEALQDRYRRTDDGAAKPIGIPRSSFNLLQHPDSRAVHSSRPVEVLKDIRVTGAIPRTASFEDTGGPFYLDRECTLEDSIADDQALLINASCGVIVLLGCAHAGVINTLRYIQTLILPRKICAVIGGFHLKNASEHRLLTTIDALKRFDLAMLAPCHCTGEKAIEALAAAFPNIFVQCNGGSRFTFPL